MTTITDDELYAYASRLKGAVVLITGGANGIGKVTALDFAKHGAKVVIGDKDEAGLRQVVEEIKKAGGEAISQPTDVLVWDSLVQLFKLAISTYGKLDIVVPNAGVSETSAFGVVKFESDGSTPRKPNLKTTEINLISVMWTTHLAMHYLILDIDKSSLETIIPDGTSSSLDANLGPGRPLKAVVLIGSVASIQGIPHAANYSAAKHGVIGLMNGAGINLQERGIRVGTICPWFADTQIVPRDFKLLMAGIPLVPVPRIAGAIIRAATDPDPKSNMSLWTLPDGGPVFRIAREQLDQGVYKMLNNRLILIGRTAGGVKYFVNTIKTLIQLTGNKGLLGIALIVGAVAGRRYLA